MIRVREQPLTLVFVYQYHRASPLRGRIEPFAKLSANARSLRIPGVHCVVFARRKTHKMGDPCGPPVSSNQDRRAMSVGGARRVRRMHRASAR